jgi:deazaflavin-dependent oxidoreductase (nitroreductase family)
MSGFVPHDNTLLQESHVKAYRETNGQTGYIWNGVPCLLLTTSGRRTGVKRTSALIFGRDGEDYLVIASTGGAARHPSWYLNIEANPDAEVQVKSDHIPVLARIASAEHKPRVWKIMTDQWPNYDIYQARTSRVIPLVVLTPR